MHRPPLPHIHGLALADVRAPPDAATLRLRRAVVDHLGLAATCPRPHCRHAGACRSRDVPCFDARRREIADAMEGFLYEGYVTDDD